MKNDYFDSDPKFSETETMQLIQELKEQKEQLQIEFKELLIAKNKAEITSYKYAELFNNSASGYFTLSESGIIIDINHIGWEMIGKESSHLLNTRFDFYITESSKPIFHNFLEKIFTDNSFANCELSFINTDDVLTYVQLAGIAVENGRKCYITALNITKCKQNESALLEEKEKLFAITEGTNIGTWEWDSYTGNVLFNNQYVEMIGYSVEELLPITPLTWRKYTHPEDLKKADEIFKRHQNGELDTYECEVRMKHKNGDWIWILDKGKIDEFDKAGNPTKILGTHQNITNRKKSEEYIKLSKETYSGIINSVSELIYILDENGYFIDVNEATEKKYGYEKGFLIGKKAEFLYAPGRNDLDKHVKAIELAQNGEPQSFNFWGITKDGLIFPKEVNLTLGTYFEKSVIIAVARDISKQKQAEIDLQNSENRYRILVESSNEGILVAQGTHLKFANSKISEICGYSQKELLTIPFINFIHPDDREMLLNNYTRRLNGEDVTKKYLVKFIKKDSTTKLVEFSSVVIDWEGEPASMNFISDITESKKIEKSLIESEERYRTLVERSPDSIVVHRDSKILFVNLAAVKMTNAKTFDELLNKSIFDFVHPDSHKLMIERGKKLENIGDFNPITEAKFIDIDGKTIDIEIQSLLIDYKGKPAVQASIRDITYRKELENLVLKADKIAKLGSWELDLNNYMMNLSKITKEILEVENDFKTNLEAAITIFDLDKNREQIIAVMNEGIETGKKWELELNFRTAKGNYKWVKIIGETEFLLGKPLKISGSFQDINDLKTIEIALLKNMKELEDYKLALDKSAIISITDEKGIILSANENFCNISQYSKAELIGSSYKLIRSDYHPEAFYKEIDDTIQSGKIWKGLVKNKTKNGDKYWEDTTIVPFLDKNNKPFQFLSILFDVTKIKNAEDEITKAKERAEESDRLKSAFLANMSHEIRTPMNGILGFTNLLKDNLSSSDQQQYIKIIEKSGVRLLSIINDIVDISKIEAEQMEIYNTETNINEQIEYIYNFFNPEISKKGIEFVFENSLPTTKAFLFTDSEKLYAILINLVKNAIKFCDKGSITIGYNLKENNETPAIEFYVKDTGVGIANNRQQAIFDRFVQADFSDKRAFQGAGLGLSISKAYVEMLGGKIWVESEIGIGTSFYFTIPYNASLETEIIPINALPEKESQIEIKKLKILIVEDDSISKLLLSKVIFPFSKEILSASTGIEAIESCRNNPDLDLVMMDVNMPQMSGYEATKKIRKFNKNVIIIAQTANALSSDKNNALAAGCNDYISKPINKEELIRILKLYFPK